MLRELEGNQARRALGLERRVGNAQTHARIRRLAGDGRFDDDALLPDIRLHERVGDVSGRHARERHAAPQPRERVVAPLFRAGDLLASEGAVARVAVGIDDTHGQVVLAVVGRVGHIQRDGRIAALVRPHRHAVHPHLGVVVGRGEPKQHAPVAPGGVQLKAPVVPPHAVVVGDPQVPHGGDRYRHALRTTSPEKPPLRHADIFGVERQFPGAVQREVQS